MLIQPNPVGHGTYKRWTLPADSRVLQVMAAYNVHPMTYPDSNDWDFLADGETCCIWKLHNSPTFSAYCSLEVLEFLGLLPVVE